MNTPKLRFKEFEKPWREVRLDSLMEFKNGINASKSSFGYGTKFINVMDILNNNYILNDSILGSVNASEKQVATYEVTYGDILFLRSSETREDVGKCNVYLDKVRPAIFGGFVICGKKIADYSPFFLKLLLNNSSVRNQISSKSGGSTRYNVSQDILRNVVVEIPEIEEQYKISSFFILQNRKIEKQKEKISSLVKNKTGIMQEIFQKKIRFKNQNESHYPEWMEIKLEEVVSIKRKGKNPIYSKKGNVLLHNEYLETGENLKFVSNEINVLKKDILILWDGSQAGNLYTNVSGVLGSTFMALSIKEDYDSLYIYYYLCSKKSMIKSAWREGSGVPHISKNFIKNFDLLLPSSKKEQEKISSFLCTFDKKIEKEKQILSMLIEQRKYFMNKMFT